MALLLIVNKKDITYKGRVFFGDLRVMNNKNIGITVLSVILAGALGFYVGSRPKEKSPPLLDLAHEKTPEPDNLAGANAPLGAGDFANKTPEELTMSLSKIMLPDEEYTKLGDAIYQTALSLLLSQAQASGVEVSELVQQELKDTIAKKYSRQYFADINASSMKELSKEDLVAILSFYNTNAGQKFLTLSPKIIENTMASVQTDLSQWLPSTVDAILAKIKTQAPSAPKPKAHNAPKASEDSFKDKDELNS